MNEVEVLKKIASYPTNTKLKIYYYLKKNGECISINKLSTDLKIDYSAIHRHIECLRKFGIIEIIKSRKGEVGKRGTRGKRRSITLK